MRAGWIVMPALACLAACASRDVTGLEFDVAIDRGDPTLANVTDVAVFIGVGDPDTHEGAATQLGTLAQPLPQSVTLFARDADAIDQVDVRDKDHAILLYTPGLLPNEQQIDYAVLVGLDASGAPIALATFEDAAMIAGKVARYDVPLSPANNLASGSERVDGLDGIELWPDEHDLSTACVRVMLQGDPTDIVIVRDASNPDCDRFTGPDECAPDVYDGRRPEGSTLSCWSPGSAMDNGNVQPTCQLGTEACSDEHGAVCDAPKYCIVPEVCECDADDAGCAYSKAKALTVTCSFGFPLNGDGTICSASFPLPEVQGFKLTSASLVSVAGVAVDELTFGSGSASPNAGGVTVTDGVSIQLLPPFVHDSATDGLLLADVVDQGAGPGRGVALPIHAEIVTVQTCNTTGVKLGCSLSASPAPEIETSLDACLRSPRSPSSP